MELTVNLTDDQTTTVYDAVRKIYAKGDVRAVLRERLPDVQLSDTELEQATERTLEIQDDNIWYMDFAERAVKEVLAKRPPKEEPKPRSVIHLGNSAGTAYYDQVLKMYGLTDGDAFKIKGSSLIYHFDNGDLLYSEKLDDERSELSDYTLGEFLFNFTKEDIELVGKPQPKDLLNDTLKLIGLGTMQSFRIDDVEFKDQTLRIDSFGDVYVVITEATDDYYEEDDEVEHDYLTLGRILTQYYDKIVPIKE